MFNLTVALGNIHISFIFMTMPITIYANILFLLSAVFLAKSYSFKSFISPFIYFFLF